MWIRSLTSSPEHIGWLEVRSKLCSSGNYCWRLDWYGSLPRIVRLLFYKSPQKGSLIYRDGLMAAPPMVPEEGRCRIRLGGQMSTALPQEILDMRLYCIRYIPKSTQTLTFGRVAIHPAHEVSSCQLFLDHETSTETIHTCTSQVLTFFERAVGDCQAFAMAAGYNNAAQVTERAGDLCYSWRVLHDLICQNPSS